MMRSADRQMERSTDVIIVVSPTAEVAELADALASGASGRKVVEVQILSSAPILIGGDPCTPPGSPHSARASPLAPFRSLNRLFERGSYGEGRLRRSGVAEGEYRLVGPRMTAVRRMAGK